MSPLEIAALGLGVLFALILLQVPIGFAMIFVGIVGFALQIGWAPALTFLAKEPASWLSSLDLSTLPLFLLMGAFASVAGFSSDIYKAAAAFLGHRRGGLAYATLIGSAAFGAICGSTLATAAAFTKIALPEMESRGYTTGFATGTIAAGGALKSLIPPSLVMILYCVIAKTFIFDMFIAAIVPAIITLTINAAAITIAVRLNPHVAPISSRVIWRDRFSLLFKAAPALVMMGAIFIGLYSGIFTVNEAASVACVLSLVFALIRRRISWNNFRAALLEAAGAAAVLYIIIIGANTFSYLVTAGQVPQALIDLIDSFHLAPLTVIILLLFVYLILGMVFDEASAIVITLPIVLPIVVNLGYDPIWWGILNVVLVELAIIHPPFGVIVFVIHGLRTDIPMGTIYRGVLPFLVADFLVIILLIAFPQLVLWLPSVLRP